MERASWSTPRLERLSEREAETELRCSWLIRDVVVLRRQPVPVVALLRGIGAIVGMIEGVEHLDNAVDCPRAAEAEPALEPQIDAVHRIADEAVAGDDRSIRAQTPGGDRLVPQIASPTGGVALAGAIQIQPAQLETVFQL